MLDLHTHIGPRGAPQEHPAVTVLSYHYLIAELIASKHLSPRDLSSFTQLQKAKTVWNYISATKGPRSQAVEDLLIFLQSYGLDDSLGFEDLLNLWPRVSLLDGLELARLEKVTGTLDPEDGNLKESERFRTINDGRYSYSWRLERIIRESGHDRSELVSRLKKMEARIWDFLPHSDYFGISLSGEGLQYLALSPYLMPEIAESCNRAGLKLALFLGVQRAYNPILEDAGDIGSSWSFPHLIQLLGALPQHGVLIANSYEPNESLLVSLARSEPRIFLFGSWWFMSYQSSMSRVLDYRIEALGAAFIPFFSDARSPEHLVMKWARFDRLLELKGFDRFGPDSWRQGVL